MSALSRFGPRVVQSTLLQHPRHMASASVSDPIQRLFLDKIKEFTASNKGLDEAHQKAMDEEMTRLKRVYNVDGNKLTQLDFKFPKEAAVSLHDIDESKELRAKISSGEYLKQLKVEERPQSAILASIKPSVPRPYCGAPTLDRPDTTILENAPDRPEPMKVGEIRPDYELTSGKMTPEKLQRQICVEFGPDMPTIDDDKSAERDTVNFPRLEQPLTIPETRFHVIPETWFKFFYPKTGVTGPYAFGIGLTTFLLSKEWLVMEHELGTGLALTIIFSTAIIKYGPKVKAFFVENVEKKCEAYKNWREGNIEVLDKVQRHYQDQLSGADLIKEIYDIRRRDIEKQLEIEQRRRYKQIFDETKSRLNYLVSVAQSARRIAHQNMVNHIITDAVRSIGAKQEEEVLDSCIASLKQMASRPSPMT